MPAERMAALQAEMAAATGAGERLQVLAELVAEVSQAGHDGTGCTAAELDEALRVLDELRAPSGPPLEPDDDAFALYLTSQACLLRDSGADLDNAIACLRELRDALLAEPSDEVPPEEAQDSGEAADGGEPPDFGAIMAEVEIKLGQALFTRVTRPGGGTADLDDAATAFRAVLHWIPSDSPARPALLAGLAISYAVRYVGYGGTQDHRMAGLALAAEGLASLEATADETANCHVVAAWMIITRQMTSEQRSAMPRHTELAAAFRGDADAAAAAVAAMGDLRIDPADAETALSHLGQVPEGADLEESLSSIAPVLASLAHLAIMNAGRVSEGIDRVAGQLEDAAHRQPPDVSERGELLGMRAAILVARASSEGHPDDLRPSAEALREAAAHLPRKHSLRGPLFNQLKESLQRQVNDAESADDFVAEIERILATLEQIPSDDPDFARALAYGTMALLRASPARRAAVPFERLLAQLDRTITWLAPDDHTRLAAEAMRCSTMVLQASMDHRPDELRRATTELMECAGRMPADNVLRPAILAMAPSALIERYVMTGELWLLDKAEKDAREALTAVEEAVARHAPSDPHTLAATRGQLVHLQALIKMARVQHEPGDHDLTQVVADLEQAAELMTPATQLQPRMVVDLETARVMRDIVAVQRGAAPSLGSSERAAFEKMLAEARAMRHDHVDFPAIAAKAASGLMMRGMVDGDQTAMGQAISLLAEACSVPGLTYRERPRLLNAYGFALLTRYHLGRDARDLSMAIDRLEEGRRAVEQELGSPYAANMLQTLAFAYRVRGDAARGDVDRAVAVGRDALRERSGDVLLQNSDANALRAARGVTSDASEMARWYLYRGRPSAAIEALEFGRATVLHAATSGARLTEALEDVGQAGLAAEWSEYMAGGKAAEDLRYRVMMAIEGSAAEVRLLAPPSLEEITAALRGSRADTLVYLLPQGDDGPGLAVLADASGNVEPLHLPRLRAEIGGPVDSFLRARRAFEAAMKALRIARARGAAAERELAEKKLQAADGPWQAALGELCDWAWQAAIGPLLEAIPARSRGSRRIVLVPGGELGLVAWHAARQPIGGGGYRYAMQEAVFSYASSARQFVSTARRQARPWTQQPVLISDANPSLLMTAYGICHLQAGYYPDAAVFGYARTVAPSAPAGPGTDAATEQDVLAVLPHDAEPGASMLHFGCHGSAEVPVLNSRLDLGEDHMVAVERILAQARKRSAQVSGGLVVLASCLTDVAEADYDEAVTLATAFLSTGAAGVVAARWAVSEHATALFMAAFHHYLNGSDRRPAQALRSAQVWMLDPGREPLRPLPTILRDEIARPDLADPVSWAGFAYQGW